MSKSKPKPEKAKARKELHVCGVINGVMGKGAFSKEGKKFLCVECGKAHDKLPEGYLEAKKKLNPKTAALLEKGSRTKTTGAEHVKWSLAGKKAWATRIKNQARFTPINAPRIPPKLVKLVNGFDKKWGRNGHEWMGSHREHSGGTTLDRARELHAKWGWIKKDNDFPLKDDAETVAFLDQNYAKVWKDRV